MTATSTTNGHKRGAARFLVIDGYHKAGRDELDGGRCFRRGRSLCRHAAEMPAGCRNATWSIRPIRVRACPRVRPSNSMTGSPGPAAA